MTRVYILLAGEEPRNFTEVQSRGWTDQVVSVRVQAAGELDDSFWTDGQDYDTCRMFQLRADGHVVGVLSNDDELCDAFMKLGAVAVQVEITQDLIMRCVRAALEAFAAGYDPMSSLSMLKSHGGRV